MIIYKKLDQSRHRIEQKRIQKELKKRWKMWRILRKDLGRNSTIRLQFNHWQILRDHNRRIFANGFLSNHQTSSRKSCGHTKNSFAFTKSHTGRMFAFGLMKTLIKFVIGVIEMMRWSDLHRNCSQNGSNCSCLSGSSWKQGFNQ